ncbi:DUF3108 domain-containing protein [Herbaspirillum rubrisubalbicans]|uniref:DUF3108 domain-containing protein n=1 Tax=Herbaspirillum rubrisubalbicans TaxID=80842 RepID=A0AAD0XIX5_9BURK|nr:DUF3108 domain-containing protein [Herbaspirillum rubrisubalbicans]AYR26284.1 DUF3108 domain-containing protein [Herbaspirillum rubrisubalbicans]
MSEVSLPPRRWPRLLILIALSLALHGVVVDWARHHIVPPGAAQEPVMTVELRPVPPPEQPVVLPAPAPAQPKRSKPARQAAPAPTRHAEPSIEPPDEPIRETVEPIYTPAPQAAHAMPAASTGVSDVSGDGQAQGGTGNGTATVDASPDDSQAPATGKQYHTSAPPSALLQYDVTGTKDQQPAYGRGSIDWHNEGNHYRVEGKAKALFFTLLNFTSVGELDAWGVSPELYTEQKGFKSATNTHFNRARNLVSFSASTTSYPRRGGEQDRASLIWQLAAIGRGDATQIQPGAVIDLFVAGVRDGELWRVQVLGQEALDLPIGHLQTWHLVRMPKPGSYDDRVDIWLAPQHEWYPVRVRYTDLRPPGDYTQLDLSELKPPEP